MLFNRQCVFGQFLDFVLRNREFATHFFRNVFDFHWFTRRSIFSEDHFDEFRTHHFAQYRRTAFAQVVFVYVEFVWIHRALNDHFAQTVRWSHEHHLVETRFGVDGEHHTRSTWIRTHHALYTCRQSHVSVSKAFVYTVRDGTVVVQRGEHVVHRFFHIVQTFNVQEGFLLTRKWSVWQVFGSGRRAHSHRNFFGAWVSNHFFPCSLNVGIQFSWKRSVHHPLTDVFAALCQSVDIVNIQSIQSRIDAVIQAFMGDEFAESVSRSCKTTRYAYAFWSQLADHFT